jgi:hypothetical protein
VKDRHHHSTSWDIVDSPPPGSINFPPLFFLEGKQGDDIINALVERLKWLRRVIRRKNGERDLNTVAKAVGASPGAILLVLAVALDFDDERRFGVVKRVRDEKDNLKRLTKRMESLSRNAEAAIPYLTDRTGAQESIDGMRVLARRFRDEAKSKSHILRQIGRKDSQGGIAIALMELYLLRHTKDQIKKNNLKEPDHLPELARLLTDAFEAFGVNRSFSSDALRKVWNRRTKHLFGFLPLFRFSPPSDTSDS